VAAAIAAVSARKIFLASDIGIVFFCSTINCLSFSEKSPSGPTKIPIGFLSVKIFLNCLNRY